MRLFGGSDQERDHEAVWTAILGLMTLATLVSLLFHADCASALDANEPSGEVGTLRSDGHET